MLNTPKPKIRYQRKVSKYVDGKLVVALKTDSFKPIKDMYTTESKKEDISQKTRGTING